jgi:hypothetical protein
MNGLVNVVLKEDLPMLVKMVFGRRQSIFMMLLLKH